jgi:hypothetical protein
MRLLKILKELLEADIQQYSDDDKQWLDLIQKRIDNATNDRDKDTYTTMYKNKLASIEKANAEKVAAEKRKDDLSKGSLTIVGSSVNSDKKEIDVKIVPKSIKDWVKENNENKIGKFYIIDKSDNLEFDEYLQSTTRETAQFFELSLDKNKNLVPQPIGKKSTRWGKDGDFPDLGRDIRGRFNIPAGKILVASFYSSYGNYLRTYIYTGKDFFKKIDTENSSI